MTEEIEETQAETRKLSTLRIVAKRQGGKEPYTAKIPVKGDTFSLVLPSGYVNWPDGKPYPDSMLGWFFYVIYVQAWQFMYRS